MDDEIQAQIETIAEEYDRDVDDIREKYEEKLDHIKSADVIGVDDDEFPKFALNTVRSSLQSNKRSGSIVSGEAEEIPIMAVGNFGVFEGWGQDDDTVMVGVGIMAPEDTEDENRPAGLGVFIMKESLGLDIGRAKNLWQWGNHIRGWFSIEKMDEDFKSRSRTYYLCGTTERSKMEEADFSGSLPSNPADIRDLLGSKFIKEDFTLDTVAENLSMEGEEFGSNWADLRRFQGQVVDYFKRTPEDCEPDQNPFGKYVLIDDSVASSEELEGDRDLVTEDDVENGRTAGLQVFLPPEMIQWGNDSTLEVYGTLTRNEETGQVTMRAAGVAPVIPFGLNDGGDGGDHDEAETEAL